MKICYAFCASFCTLERSMKVMEELARAGSEILPVFSFAASGNDTRFGTAASFIERAERVCGRKPVLTLPEAEPIGPVVRPDLMIVAPLSGTSLAKIDLGISDTPVTLAVKAHLRNERPLLLALASNDAMGANFVHLARLFQRKNVFFAPLRQDDVLHKPNSLVCEFETIPRAAQEAMKGRQMRPLFL